MSSVGTPMDPSLVLSANPPPSKLHSNHSDRVFGLDILRAIAILCVVYVHGWGYLSPCFSKSVGSFYLGCVVDGVSVFFVLSGFLIGSILLKTISRSFSISDLYVFWIRRWFRTLPNYFLVLFTLILIRTVISKQPLPSWKYLVFLQNFAGPTTEFFPESWSLSVEEWFYLMIPGFVFLCTRLLPSIKRKNIFFVVIWLVMAISFTARYIHAPEVIDIASWENLLRKQVITRLDAIMLGCMAAWIRMFRTDLWTRSPKRLFWVGLFLWFVDLTQGAVFGVHPLAYLRYFDAVVVPLGTFLMLPWMSTLLRGPDWISKPVTFVSLISYSMYLLNHSFIAYVIARLFRGVPGNLTVAAIQYLLYWALTISLSYFLFRFWETPMMNLRDKYCVRLCRSTNS